MSSDKVEKETSPYITVQFEDGPEQGLLTEITEDDQCDPRFWRFDEVHSARPAAKILFGDGVAMYADRWPSGVDGIVIDGDGDVHNYVMEEQKFEGSARTVMQCRRTAGKAEGDRSGQSKVKLCDEGGWVHTVEEEAESPLRERKTKKRRDEDEDWRDDKKRQKKHHSRSSKKRRVVHDEDAADVSSALPSERDKCEPSERGSQMKDVLASPSGFCPVVSSETPELPLVLETPAALRIEEPASVVSLVEKEQSRLDPSSIVGRGVNHQAPSLQAGGDARETPTDTSGEKPSADNQDEIEGRRHCVRVERAKTARSTCRICDEQVLKDDLRVGMDAFSSGRTMTLWSHASCFLKSVTVEYASARRGKCKGSGVAFVPGDIRVCFEVAAHKTWWLPREAARFTSLMVRQGASLVAPKGLELIDDGHSGALLALLGSEVAPPCQLRREQQVATSRCRSTSAGTPVQADTNVPQRPLTRLRRCISLDEDVSLSPVADVRDGDVRGRGRHTDVGIHEKQIELAAVAGGGGVRSAKESSDSDVEVELHTETLCSTDQTHPCVATSALDRPETEDVHEISTGSAGPYAEQHESDVEVELHDNVSAELLGSSLERPDSDIEVELHGDPGVTEVDVNQNPAPLGSRSRSLTETSPEADSDVEVDLHDEPDDHHVETDDPTVSMAGADGAESAVDVGPLAAALPVARVETRTSVHHDLVLSSADLHESDGFVPKTSFRGSGRSKEIALYGDDFASTSLQSTRGSTEDGTPMHGVNLTSSVTAYDDDSLDDEPFESSPLAHVVGLNEVDSDVEVECHGPLAAPNRASDTEGGSHCDTAVGKHIGAVPLCMDLAFDEDEKHMDGVGDDFEMVLSH